MHPNPVLQIRMDNKRSASVVYWWYSVLASRYLAIAVQSH